MAANGPAAGPPPPSRPPQSAAAGGSAGPTPKPHPTAARHWRQFTERYGWRAYAL
ncbi:MAG: hypothetical protein JWN47_875, partial [Frankiales bacterium]|nr:hypothetical protein [Frankiales bacterium]